MALFGLPSGLPRNPAEKYEMPRNLGGRVPRPICQRSLAACDLCRKAALARGHGRRLIEAAEAEARARGCRRAWRASRGARDLPRVCEATDSDYALERMLKRDYDGQKCSIARALEVVGERWTLLIVRDAFLGLRRFDHFQESLGIARNVLTDRLNRLVEEGILERVRYTERPERYEYQLTRKGRDLNIALAALMQWGDRYLSEKPPRINRRKADKKPVIAALVPKGTEVLRVDEVESVPGPERARREPVGSC